MRPAPEYNISGLSRLLSHKIRPPPMDPRYVPNITPLQNPNIVPILPARFSVVDPLKPRLENSVFIAWSGYIRTGVLGVRWLKSIEKNRNYVPGNSYRLNIFE